MKIILIITIFISSLLITNLSACPSKFKNSCGTNKAYKNSIISNVINAVSKVGLNATQTKKIADGIKEYRATMHAVKSMKIFPLDSFLNDSFDEKHFIKEMSQKSNARIAAKATLFKYIFAVLNDRQKISFKQSYAAPVIKKMIFLNL